MSILHVAARPLAESRLHGGRMSDPDPISGLTTAALEYASQGIKVFACKPRGKEPLTEHGFKDATADGTRIREWWSKWPDATSSRSTATCAGHHCTSYLTCPTTGD